MVDRRQKKKKKRLLKRSKKVKKRNLDLKINGSEPHIWSLSINFRFHVRKSQSQSIKTGKNRSLILQYSFAQKPLSFYEPQFS